MNANRAMQFALQKMGAGRVDKSGNSYVLHLIQTCDGLREGLVGSGQDPNDEDALSAAILHDTIEDSDATLEDLRALGFDDRLIGYVDALTKREGESYVAYLVRCRAGGSIPASIKVADAASNADLSRLGRAPKPEDYDRALKYSLVCEFFRADENAAAAGVLAALVATMLRAGRISEEQAARDVMAVANTVCRVDGRALVDVLPMIDIEAVAAMERGRANVRNLRHERLGARYPRTSAA
jgi:hypothetical protein